jgi:hypothetical protein
MFSIRTAIPYSTVGIEIRLRNPAGTLVGTCSLPETGNYQCWQTNLCSVMSITGIHNIFLVYRGNVNVNWFQITLVPNIQIG